MKSSETQTAEELLTNLQVNYWKEENPHKRGHLARKINSIYVQVCFLEACLDLPSDYTPYPENDE